MSPLGSLARWLGHQAWFARIGRGFVPVDRWLLTHTRARWVLGAGQGLPTLVLTTTGRRTGQPRSTPLMYTEDGDGYIVVGSNWGQAHHPAWAGNLVADPDATITLGDRTVPVRAHTATGAERDRLWRKATANWPAYETYVTRAQGRELRVFRLVPREPAG